MTRIDADDAYASISTALRKANDAIAQKNRDLAELRARFDMLLDVLIGRGLLNEGHKKVLARVGRGAAASEPSRVKLRVLVDKYAVPDAGIDCASLMHLCHGRCCAMSFELTTQDLDEGVVRWEVEDPYVIRHEPDGYCTHLDRGARGCTIYDHRPATCRGYDCRGDTRVWIDFEKRIPAPMPEALLAMGARGAAE